MEFKNGDVVKFKASDFNMVVCDDTLKHSHYSGMVQCKWFDPTLPENKQGFNFAFFNPFELEIINQSK